MLCRLYWGGVALAYHALPPQLLLKIIALAIEYTSNSTNKALIEVLQRWQPYSVAITIISSNCKGICYTYIVIVTSYLLRSNYPSVIS